MHSYKRTISLTIATIILILLIFDSKTSMLGATEGIELCLATIIPALFPFIFVTLYLNACITNIRIPGIRLLGKCLKISPGNETLFLLGLLGGYPSGASLISNMYSEKKVTPKTASILMGYCNNAGPAFIFGVTSHLFPSAAVPWCIWIIQILSAIITALLLPRPYSSESIPTENYHFTIVNALKQATQTCSTICGWVIVFRIIIAYISKITCNCSVIFSAILNGLLELSNGCATLAGIHSDSLRFLLCTAFLSFGGLCVMLQISNIAGEMGLGFYIPGKIMQTLISVSLSAMISPLLFKTSNIKNTNQLILTASAVFILLIFQYLCRKKFWKSKQI